MDILCVGLSHKTAPLEVRESVAFTRQQVEEALPSLRGLGTQGVILSTCNRTEIYTVSADSTVSFERLQDFLAGYHGVAAQGLSPYLCTYEGKEAARHLFRVASGLESMILGSATCS